MHFFVIKIIQKCTVPNKSLVAAGEKIFLNPIEKDKRFIASHSFQNEESTLPFSVMEYFEPVQGFASEDRNRRSRDGESPVSCATSWESARSASSFGKWHCWSCERAKYRSPPNARSRHHWSYPHKCDVLPPVNSSLRSNESFPKFHRPFSPNFCHQCYWVLVDLQQWVNDTSSSYNEKCEMNNPRNQINQLSKPYTRDTSLVFRRIINVISLSFGWIMNWSGVEYLQYRVIVVYKILTYIYFFALTNSYHRNSNR